MTYRHLLSRRTALLRSGALLGALALPACSDSFSPPETVSESPAASVKLLATTDHPVVGPTRSTVLRATAVKSDGSQHSLDAEWQSLDGGAVRDTVINGKTLPAFSADEPGTYRLIGSSMSLSLADTTSVLVASLSQTSSIVKLVLSPAQATLRTNDTLHYSVYGLTATGERVPAAATLHPDRGWAIGLDYVTPITGRFMVRAILEGGGVADTAFVDVTTTAPLQPDPGSDDDPAAPTEPVEEAPESEPLPDLGSGTLARVVMSPATALLRVNDTLRFRIFGVTTAGDTVAVSAALKPDRGYAVDGYKYVTPITGTFRVRAIAANGMADTSFVTVTSDAPLQDPSEPAPSPSPEPEPEPAPEPAPTPSDPAPGASPAAPPELPRAWVDTRYVPPTGRVIRVAAGDNLQLAINAAARGDVIELPAGAVFTGNFVLPAKSGSGWVTIRTATTLPPEGVRVTPTSASNFAKLVTPNSMPALYTATSASASYYRIVGIEFRSAASMTYAIVNLGDYMNTASSVSELAGNIVLDRVWIHGSSTQTISRCLALNSRAAAIIDSRLSDCHVKGGDSQGIAGWTGPGPYKIVNNYIDGAGENIMFGGSDPKFTGLVPSDIEIRRNHITKPLSWKSSGAWSVKNLFELKNAQRVLVEGNVFENNWADAQTGFAVVLKSVNQSGRCTWCVVQDIAWRYNKVINSPSGFNLLSSAGGAIPARRISITHTVFDKVGTSIHPGDRRIFQFLGALTHIAIEHTTSTTSVHSIVFDGAPASDANYSIRDNFFARGMYGVFGSGKGEGAGAIAYYAPGSLFTRNVVVAAPSSQYPTGSYYPSSFSAAGLLNYLTGDYSLAPGSAYTSAASDGTAIGADVARLESMTAGVR